MAEKILIVGALGQIGSELTQWLRAKHGKEAVIASDRREAPAELRAAGPFEQLDAMDEKRVREIVADHQITQVYHLVAMLSATAENHPRAGWDLNMETLFIFLNLAKEGKIKRLFWPSSIAAFGPTTPKANTAQHTVMDPGTVYGISKLAGELWCRYYHEKYGVDVRSLRYPGLISYQTEPGGGTTDYAVEIFSDAIKKNHYTCFLSAERRLPMMYMADAVRATVELMEAPAGQIKERTSYNLAALDFDPAELAAEIKKQRPDFQIDYAPDQRDEIAKGWPRSIDDSAARKDWAWQHQYDLEALVKNMLAGMAKKHEA